MQTAAALYEGRAGAETGRVSIGGANLPAAGFACKGCHGRDGRGGGESNAPAIDGETLFTDASDRPAYDERSFAAVIAGGLASDGRTLSTVMPRYALTPAVIAGMADYLRDLPRRQRQGVTAETITFAVPAGRAAPAFANAYAARLEAHLGEALESGRVYARAIRVIVLEGEMASVAQAADSSALAVVAMPGEDLAVFTARGVPALLPLAPLRGDEDPALVRALAPSWQHIARALADRLTAQNITTLAVVGDDPTHPLLPGLRAAGWKGEQVPQRRERLAALKAWPGRGVLLTRTAGEPATAIVGRIPGELPVFLTAAQAGAEMTTLLARRNVRVIVEAPILLDAALQAGTGALDAHATVAAAVLAEALRAAGPDPTRTGLVRAFDGIVLAAYGLDYRREPLTGTSVVRTLPDAGER